MSEAKQSLIVITPEPTPEELAAIVAAISVATARDGTPALPYDPSGRASRWSRQGRREAMRGLDRNPGATDPRPGRGR